MSANAQIVYSVTETIAPNATGSLVNAATVMPPADVDTTPGNNSSSTSVTLVPTADLSITKTDNVDTVTTGQLLTYTIVARNTGPSTVTGATVTDTFPANFTGVTYT
jgi:uncharacterized repeat protein (TIGR01451 family)